MKDNLKHVVMTEDEFNNMLIDMWLFLNKEENKAEPGMYEIFDALTGKAIKSPEPLAITITLKEGTYGR